MDGQMNGWMDGWMDGWEERIGEWWQNVRPAHKSESSKFQKRGVQNKDSEPEKHPWVEALNWPITL